MKTIQLTPSCKDYLWGGEKLRTEYGIQSELHPLSEAWMLSCHPDGPSYLPDGSTFQQYINAHPGCLGTHCEKFSEFPVLAKLIDAKKDLSIQVHPSNEYALEHEHQYGKTEMWYVLEAEPGASLYYGFTHEISKEEFERRIQDNTLTDVLNAVPVHKGDCFFIPSGTLHAIRKGIVVAEIQQNSNVTYRIYDYGRLGADGKPRQLHIPQALDVTLREPPKAQDFHGHLAQCDYFTVDAVEGGFEDVCDETSFTSQLLQGGILRFKVQCQPDALYRDLHLAIAVHVPGKGFQLGLQLAEKGSVRVGAAHHCHGVVRPHLGDPVPDKIPHRQQGSSDQHHIIPVVVPPVGTLLRRGQGRGRFLDQVFGFDIPFVAVGCHGCVLVSSVFLHLS